VSNVFPQIELDHKVEGCLAFGQSGGLTLRQHYAGLAMQGFCANADPEFMRIPIEDCCSLSVKMADALIAALEVKPA
jgi:hypothetical protein